MTEKRPLVPEDLDEREAERRRRQEFVRRERARVVAGVTLESREQRLRWREKEIRLLMTRELQRLSYGDSDLEIMPAVLAQLFDLVDDMILFAIHAERERTRSAEAATKAGRAASCRSPAQQERR
jgi:hypothetical protein